MVSAWVEGHVSADGAAAGRSLDPRDGLSTIAMRSDLTPAGAVPYPAHVARTEDPVGGIESLTRRNRRQRDPRLERRLVRTRHEAFTAVRGDPGRATWPPEVDDPFPDLHGAPPEISAGELDVTTLGGGILHHGCVLVRGLLDPDTAARFVDGIDRAFAAHDRYRAGEGPSPDGWWAPFRSADGWPSFPAPRRAYVRQAGGILLADSPRLLFEVLEAFEAAGLRSAITEYLGERPAIAADKSTLRRVTPDKMPSWHQDGSFLGDGVRTVNTWVALTPCGGEAPAPGLDIVPRRLDALARAGAPGARVAIEVLDDDVAAVADGAPILRPVFEPGDALLFDELFLHRTATSPGMTDARYAIESWSFAPSSFPPEYFPLVW